VIKKERSHKTKTSF